MSKPSFGVITKDLSEVNCDGEASCSSVESLDSGLGTSTLESLAEEEERLMIENEKTAVAEKSANIAPGTKESEDTHENGIMNTEAKLKEKKLKRLMHLLKSSQMYAVILGNRLKEDEAKAKKKIKKPKTGLNDVLNEKDIKDTAIENKEENNESATVEEDFFKETRTTSLGFTVSIKQPQLLEGGAMRNFQLKGLQWMINLFNNGVNGILADEMGLGKTLQVISFICYLIEQDIKGPFLVIAPLSTISNWMSEFKKFAPKVPVLLYHGSEPQRKQLRGKIHETVKIGKKGVHYVIITSYEVPIYDNKFLSKIHWFYMIIDEGHRIKNHQSRLSTTLRKFNTIGRLLLTGTPLQNDLSELWSLLNFLLPEVFNSLDVFESWFDIKSLEKNGEKFMQEKYNLHFVSTLQEILMPFLLRREKKDVNLQLPPKKEILIYCPMTQIQKKLYESVLDRSIERFLKPVEDNVIYGSETLPKRRCFLLSPYGKTKNDARSPVGKRETPKKEEEEEEEEERYFNHIRMQNTQMQLRQIVNHPYLIQFPIKEGTEDYKIDESMVQASGKLLVLDAMLSKLKSRGHRVFVVSCFKLLLDILEEHALMRGYKYCRFDGTDDIAFRNEEISRFTMDPDVFVFYSTIRAGGLGINLTAADTVVLFDSDWNPQVNLQAQDRCHRIGQTKPVVVYKLCTTGTIDEKIMERGHAKRRLEKMILQEGKFSSASKRSFKMSEIDLQELKGLLESTGQDIVINSNGFVFSDEELDGLLDRTDMTPVEKVEVDSEEFKLFSEKK